MDADTGQIVATGLTGRDADDRGQVGSLLGEVEDVSSFTAGGAYDRDDVYAAVAARQPGAEVILPPRQSGVPSAASETAPTRGDRHLQSIAECGRTGWQKAPG